MLYCMFQYRISEKTIERAYFNNPMDTNADGTIDYYEANMGEWNGFASYNFESYDEAQSYFERMFPTIWEQEEVQIVVRPRHCECCKNRSTTLVKKGGLTLVAYPGHGEICHKCKSEIEKAVESLDTQHETV